MEQFVILVVIALISFINWIIQRSAELREKKKLEQKNLGIPEGNPYQQAEAPEPLPAPANREPADPAAEMRKLMEALGIPLEDPAPPVVTRQQPPVEPPPLPAAPPQPVPAPRRLPLPPQSTTSSTPPRQGPLAAALRSRTSLRNAIVLREILGPPRALAPR